MFSAATRQRGYFAWAAFLFLCMCAVADSLPTTNLLPENPVVLNMFWRISFGPDYAETTDRAEMMRNSPSGIIYYVPAAPNDPQGAQMQPVYRLFTPHIPDHMSSIKKGEGGYNTEGILGYAWVNPNAHPGLSPIQRVYNDQAGSPHYRDHALMVGQTTTPEAKTQDNLLSAGYHFETPLGYAYARYPSATNDQFLATVAAEALPLHRMPP